MSEGGRFTETIVKTDVFLYLLRIVKAREWLKRTKAVCRQGNAIPYRIVQRRTAARMRLAKPIHLIPYAVASSS